jgi:hypothetical protein
MFEMLSQFAAQAATHASRRQFLGRLGRGALAATSALGGLLVLPSDADAATVCGAGSTAMCAGRAVGARCGFGRGPFGVCVGAPYCLCRTCSRGQSIRTCSNGAYICCPRGYDCYTRRGKAKCRRSA